MSGPSGFYPKRHKLRHSHQRYLLQQDDWRTWTFGVWSHRSPVENWHWNRTTPADAYTASAAILPSRGSIPGPETGTLPRFWNCLWRMPIVWNQNWRSSNFDQCRWWRSFPIAGAWWECKSVICSFIGIGRKHFHANRYDFIRFPKPWRRAFQSRFELQLRRQLEIRD